MALVECYECGNRISSSASSCPKCGAPVTQLGDTVDKALTTTQLTSKTLKIQVAISRIIFWLAIIGLVVAVYLDLNVDIQHFTIVSAIMGFCIVWYMIVKTMIWWHHK